MSQPDAWTIPSSFFSLLFHKKIGFIYRIQKPHLVQTIFWLFQIPNINLLSKSFVYAFFSLNSTWEVQIEVKCILVWRNQVHGHSTKDLNWISNKIGLPFNIFKFHFSLLTFGTFGVGLFPSFDFNSKPQNHFPSRGCDTIVKRTLLARNVWGSNQIIVICIRTI